MMSVKQVPLSSFSESPRDRGHRRDEERMAIGSLGWSCPNHASIHFDQNGPNADCKSTGFMPSEVACEEKYIAPVVEIILTP